jgi:hypothetical protein
VNAPASLPCDPLARVFPPGWKDVWFRRNAVEDDDGIYRYECPLCRRRFDHSDFGYLQGDHVWPYSLFGESSWENYQLLCGGCNASKGNRLRGDVRRTLGEGSFRAMVVNYLKGRFSSAGVGQDPLLQQLLAHVSNSG